MVIMLTLSLRRRDRSHWYSAWDHGAECHLSDYFTIIDVSSVIPKHNIRLDGSQSFIPIGTFFFKIGQDWVLNLGSCVSQASVLLLNCNPSPSQSSECLIKQNDFFIHAFQVSLMARLSDREKVIFFHCGVFVFVGGVVIVTFVLSVRNTYQIDRYFL